MVVCSLLHLLVLLITFQTVARPVAEIFGGVRFTMIYIFSGAIGYLHSYMHSTGPAMGTLHAMVLREMIADLCTPV